MNFDELDIVVDERVFNINVYADLPFLEEVKEIVPEFEGIGSNILTPWIIKPDVRFSYTLPKIANPEEIEVSLTHSADSSELSKCNCFEYLVEFN